MTTVQHQLIIPPALQGRRLDQALAALLPDYSRSRLKAWIVGGQVLLDGATSAPRTAVQSGQLVQLSAELEPQSEAAPAAMSLDVVFADDDVIVLNKPAGLVVHPGAGNRDGTLVSGLLHRWPELAELPRGGLLHRLDKDTTGLLVIARSLAAHTRLVQDLQERRITREYRALCNGRMTAGGMVDAPLGRHPVHRTRMAVTPGGRESITHYRVLRRFAAHSFLALRLETGRTHQIRVHLAHVRHPIFGDATYGGRRILPPGAAPDVVALLQGFRRQALHASRLTLDHPISGETLSLQAPLPADFLAVLRALAGPEGATTNFDELQWPTADSS